MRIEIPWFKKEEKDPWKYEIPLACFDGYAGEIDIKFDDNTGKLDVTIVDGTGNARMNVGSVNISRLVGKGV